MCLDSIDRRIKRPTATVVEAWKKVYSEDGKVFTSVVACELKSGRWMKANKHRAFNEYPAGFHAYALNDPPEYWICENLLVKVRLRYVHTIGRQDGHNVLVAREMLLPHPKARKYKRRRYT